MQGVILAGGNGTRLRPLTMVANKHLLPVYDKPMIYYPIETLKELGITDILLVSGGEHIGGFAELLGDGTELGVRLTYRVQEQADGIAGALKLAEGFADDLFAVILGDNYFESVLESDKPTIFVKEVPDPERFGVYDHTTNTITEKPKVPASNYAVTGLYIYDQRVFEVLPTLKPSKRGELEITDINNWYLGNGATVVGLPGYWRDMGTFNSLQEVSNWVAGTDNN